MQFCLLQVLCVWPHAIKKHALRVSDISFVRHKINRGEPQKDPSISPSIPQDQIWRHARARKHQAAQNQQASAEKSSEVAHRRSLYRLTVGKLILSFRSIALLNHGRPAVVQLCPGPGGAGAFRCRFGLWYWRLSVSCVPTRLRGIFGSYADK